MFVTFSARFHTSALRALKPQKNHEIPMPFQRKLRNSFAGKSPSENLSLTPEISSQKPCPTPARHHARKACQTPQKGRKHWFGNWFGNWLENWSEHSSENGSPNWSEKWSEHWRKNLGNLRRRPLGASRNMKHRISAAVADTKRKRAENVLWHTGT